MTILNEYLDKQVDTEYYLALRRLQYGIDKLVAEIKQQWKFEERLRIYKETGMLICSSEDI